MGRVWWSSAVSVCIFLGACGTDKKVSLSPPEQNAEQEQKVTPKKQGKSEDVSNGTAEKKADVASATSAGGTLVPKTDVKSGKSVTDGSSIPVPSVGTNFDASCVDEPESAKATNKVCVFKLNRALNDGESTLYSKMRVLVTNAQNRITSLNTEIVSDVNGNGRFDVGDAVRILIHGPTVDDILTVGELVTIEVFEFDGKTHTMLHQNPGIPWRVD